MEKKKAPKKIWAGPLDNKGDVRTPFCECHLSPYLDYIHYTKSSDMKQALEKDRLRYEEYLDNGIIAPSNEIAYDFCRDVINNLYKIITQLEE